jgi:hypothetical protein
MVDTIDLKRAYLEGLLDGLKQVGSVVDKCENEIEAKLRAVEDECARQNAIATATATERDPAAPLS